MTTRQTLRLERYLQVVCAFLTPGAVIVLAALNDVPPGGPTLSHEVLVRAVLVCVISAGAAATIPAVAQRAGAAGRHREDS